ncbi:hypothetical protein AZL_006790 [Azospirillum sp. B510]|uniref:DUF1329 domain-containing protein n=1 Tax=Azospirillum sp. (strain B510) TaxID=137722 RepID=UPI0001C4C0BE|nr:DUF1329 domain-containing protein [Azospirillum sp. B510]BAI71317.1 hypothetical protein AZL_006790 [Azospirillum sp. B510]
MSGPTGFRPDRRQTLGLLLGAAASAAAASAAEPALAQGTPPANAAPPTPPADVGVPRLGEELTPFGAVRAGNRTRAIPPWTGGLTEPPRGYVPGRPSPDPYIEDVRWFTVTAADVERYKVRLTAGQQALLAKYPESFQLALFPCRRSAAAPQRIYDASLANAGRAAVGENGMALRDATVGVPFPIPANGVQAMWNHKLRWRGGPLSRTSLTVVQAGDGTRSFSRLREDFLSPYAAGDMAAPPLLYRRTILDPKEQAGGSLILQGTLDPIATRTRAWVREGERGRVVPAPDFAYDTPDPVTGGICTADMLDMFSGALDRFDYTLVTRREMYMPYNAHRLVNPNLAMRDTLWPGHPNPQFLRYEMHRVWVVDARLKPNFKHALPDRTFYLDEDSWQILASEHYNGKGDLLRYAEAHTLPHWQVPVLLPTVEFAFDLTADRYAARGMENGQPPPQFDAPLTPEDFTADALIRRGRRG